MASAALSVIAVSRSICRASCSSVRLRAVMSVPKVWKTARDNVALGLTFNGMERKKALAEAEGWLERLDLWASAIAFPVTSAAGSASALRLRRRWP